MLTMLWAGLECVIVVFPDHTYLVFFDVKVLVFVLRGYHKKFPCACSECLLTTGFVLDNLIHVLH